MGYNDEIANNSGCLSKQGRYARGDVSGWRRRSGIGCINPVLASWVVKTMRPGWLYTRFHGNANLQILS